MSDDQNHLDYSYMQLSKIYDECLDYLNENHEDLQTILETEEPGYETINELQPNTNRETSQGFNGLNNYDNENPVKSLNELDIVLIQDSNILPNHHDGTEKVNCENGNDPLYETLNPIVKISDDKISEMKTDDVNKNELALVKYNETPCVLYETLNPHVNYANNSLKEDNIQVIINNDDLKYNVTELDDDNNDSHENLEYVVNEANNEDDRIENPNLQNLEGSKKQMVFEEGKKSVYEKSVFKLENEIKSLESLGSVKSERLRKLSQQLPKIVITSSSTSLNLNNNDRIRMQQKPTLPRVDKMPIYK